MWQRSGLLHPFLLQLICSHKYNWFQISIHSHPPTFTASSTASCQPCLRVPLTWMKPEDTLLPTQMQREMAQLLLVVELMLLPHLGQLLIGGIQNECSKLENHRIRGQLQRSGVEKHSRGSLSSKKWGRMVSHLPSPCKVSLWPIIFSPSSSEFRKLLICFQGRRGRSGLYHSLKAFPRRSVYNAASCSKCNYWI